MFTAQGLRGRLLGAIILVPAAAALAADEPAKGRLRFEKQTLVRNLAEGCAIADVNKDGKLDVIAGPNWYEAPGWKPHPIREMQPTGPDNEYMGTNGDHAIDLNGDGWIDVLAASWFSDEIHWFENPGADGLKKGTLWKEHPATKGYPECEGTLLEDLDGDGKPELLINRWTQGHAVPVVKITPGDKGGSPAFKVFEIGKPGTHGAGIGDINGDRRPDIIFESGWFENPGGDIFASTWKYHRAFNAQHLGLPVLILDLTGDGRNDVIMSHAHDYGLFWYEQGPPRDGEITWTRHEIDKSFSQVHCLAWADLDGNGRKEIITGKRWRAHNNADPGAKDPICLLRFEWDPKARTFTKDVISYNEDVGTGMQIRVQDLNADGKLDIAVAGKTGTHVLINKGKAP